MNECDAVAWKMQRRGMSVRQIAREMELAPSSVQRMLARAQKRAQESSLERELDAIVASYDDGKLTCEKVTRPEQIELLDDLQYHRLRDLPLDHPARDRRGRAKPRRTTPARSRPSTSSTWRQNIPGSRLPATTAGPWRSARSPACSSDTPPATSASPRQSKPRSSG
jgi:hypothetical protein